MICETERTLSCIYGCYSHSLSRTYRSACVVFVVKIEPALLSAALNNRGPLKYLQQDNRIPVRQETIFSRPGDTATTISPTIDFLKNEFWRLMSVQGSFVSRVVSSNSGGMGHTENGGRCVGGSVVEA